MQQTVTIYRDKTNKKIKVKFIYNVDLLDVMREHKGWWNKKEKAWIFSLHKLPALQDNLSSKMYRIRIITEKPTIPNEEVCVEGMCKKCYSLVLVNRKRLCKKCNNFYLISNK